MITARLVGDDAVLAWLRAAPDLVASGLARAITTLGIELQRNIQEIELTGQTLGARSGSLESSTSLQIDQSGDRIAATISSGSAYKHAREYSFSGAVAIRANLRRRTKAFARPNTQEADQYAAVHPPDRRSGALFFAVGAGRYGPGDPR
jgi:hypothetical protein